MPAYSFKERFVPLIKDGSKTQTIRAKRKNKIKIGDPVYLYYGMRTKHCLKIGEGVCTGTYIINIEQSGKVFIDYIMLSKKDKELLAINDGFKNWEDMYQWWQQTHELPFDGNIIHWKLNYNNQK